MHSNKRIDQYLVGKTLGKGGFSKVKEGFDPKSGSKVALKFDLIYNPKSAARKETLIQMKLQECCNILSCFGSYEGMYWNGICKERTQSYIVMELAKGGSLFDLRTTIPFGNDLEIISRTYFNQLISAVEYIHYNNIVHLDLKPENLLLDEDHHLKVAGFGLADYWKEEIEERKKKVGTIPYMAPEVHMGQYGPAADVFACGIILYNLLFDSSPFMNTTDCGHWDLIVNERWDTFWQITEANVSSEVKDLIQQIFQPDQEQRIKIAEIKRHPWCQGLTMSKESLKNWVNERNDTYREAATRFAVHWSPMS